MAKSHPLHQRLPDGRRRFSSQDRAIKACLRQVEETGVWSGVRRNPDGTYSLLFDTQSE